jgi:CRP-like cAMP-binding protein
VLVEEGDPGDDFFVIEQGAATVTRDGRHITEMEAGDFFGERALLETERRTATVTAISPMTVIVMSREAFLELDRSNPEVHATVAEAIAARQR